MVKERLLGHPTRPQMTMETVESVANHLFPVHDGVVFNCDTSKSFKFFSEEEFQSACSRLKNKKATGPGNILPEIVKQVAHNKPGYML